MTYVGYIWIAEGPGIRFSIPAQSPDEAREAIEAEYGKGHVISLWNEDDSSKPR
jgi:hypothetical protein